MGANWAAWLILLSVLALSSWWVFRTSARSRKTDFRVIAASAVMVLMSGGFVFWQSGFIPTTFDDERVELDLTMVIPGPDEEGEAICPPSSDPSDSQIDVTLPGVGLPSAIDGRPEAPWLSDENPGNDMPPSCIQISLEEMANAEAIPYPTDSFPYTPIDPNQPSTPLPDPRIPNWRGASPEGWDPDPHGNRPYGDGNRCGQFTERYCDVWEREVAPGLREQNPGVPVKCFGLIVKGHALVIIQVGNIVCVVEPQRETETQVLGCFEFRGNFEDLWPLKEGLKELYQLICKLYPGPVYLPTHLGDVRITNTCSASYMDPACLKAMSNLHPGSYSGPVIRCRDYSSFCGCHRISPNFESGCGLGCWSMENGRCVFYKMTPVRHEILGFPFRCSFVRGDRVLAECWNDDFNRRWKMGAKP
jgi:hypothetical protein